MNKSKKFDALEWEEVELAELAEKIEYHRVHVVISEQHTLSPQQVLLLKGYDVNFIKVPANGWTLNEMKAVLEEWKRRNYNIIFVSPIPFLIKSYAFYLGELWNNDNFFETPPFCKVMFNEKREKVELPDGKVISKTAQDGWQLV